MTPNQTIDNRPVLRAMLNAKVRSYHDIDLKFDDDLIPHGKDKNAYAGPIVMAVQEDLGAE